jgi:hypothetical protein
MIETSMSLPKESLFAEGHAVQAARSLPSVFVSVLIAFVPKCPACLAAYLSMFGSVGLALTPYMGWLYPVLVVLLGVHLVLLLQKAPRKGYGPFLFSVAGAAIILGSRALVSGNRFVTISGILLILSGSLWNSVSTGHHKKFLLNN